ncbi:MAG: lipid carrier--UDP-N-acetylgalactosaminyltransferase [Flavobacteriaceae bacterium]|mgnify:CR=1 FL=1|nr:lipid carrier--UDP-N-acetylgalactosaminyltransferase [Flavobacteriaceae bacterium]|tara:strand:+ start:83204 stop:83848 length:645 start_codon:yes stop_codon:yes gene_type:complete
MYANFIKVILDFCTALVILILLSPVFIFVFLALTIANNGQPFFYQIRPGKNEKLFKIVKFRTMNNKRDDSGTLLPDAKRLTFIGKFVRKTSLDELPQLFNILKFEMSLVGPRPLLPEYLPLYTLEQKKRHLVKPGITGLAQVRGRNQMLFSERLKNDVFYVENQSFILDLKIILETIYTVFFKSKNVVLGQTVDEVDDLGLSRNLDSNHFKTKK